MPKRLPALLLALALVFSGQPAAAQAAGTGSVIRERQRFVSPALGREMAYCLYLPPGFDPKGGPYPVVYLLHGVGDDDSVWPLEGKVQETADRLIGEGALPASIIVMPDGKTSWYVDSAEVGGPGNYDTAIDRDLVGMIDATLPTIARQQGRAIAGVSMGGYGALRFALRQPHRYAAVAALSPALWLRVKPGFAVDEQRMARVFRGSFGQPFSVERFLQASPVNEIKTLAGDAERPSIMLAIGTAETFSPADTEAFRDMLAAAGVPARLTRAEGNHNWAFWSAELDEVLRAFGREFARQR
ncbi:MAG: hypothetical protein HYR63_04855 [Proteobacteria bacterium]|nr:hypothetical protein [Pseudomonadota bacterium]MBI3496633.1 hypothetical protein [Pseudomonadota bacterium]